MLIQIPENAIEPAADGLKFFGAEPGEWLVGAEAYEIEGAYPLQNELARFAQVVLGADGIAEASAFEIGGAGDDDDAGKRRGVERFVDHIALPDQSGADFTPFALVFDTEIDEVDASPFNAQRGLPNRRNFR